MDEQALSRRHFLRRGALWVAGAAVVEPVAKRLWAFPTNPMSRSRHTLVTMHDLTLSHDDGTVVLRAIVGGRVWEVHHHHYRAPSIGDLRATLTPV